MTMNPSPGRLLALSCVLAIGCSRDNATYLPKPRPPEVEPNTASSTATRATTGENRTTSPAVTPPVTAGSGGAASASTVNQTSPGELSEADRRRQAVDQLTRIGQVFEAYLRANRTYPQRRAFAGGFSWRVSLLAQFGQANLLATFSKEEAWDQPSNRPALARNPSPFKSADRADGKTNFVLITGNATAYPTVSGLRTDQFSDGLDNTLLVAEVDDAFSVPWTAPDDYEFRRETVQQAFFGKHKDCCYAWFGGSTGVRRIPANISDEHLLALITPAGGELVDVKTVTRAPTVEVDAELLAELKEHPVVRFAPLPEPESTAAVASPEAAADHETPASQTRVPAVASATGQAPSTDVQGPSPAGAPDGRWAVPEDAALQQAAAMFREIYGDVAKTARSLSEKRALARKMFEQSGSLAADPAGMYVLLRAARDVAAQAGDVDTAFHAILEMAAAFRVDSLALQLKALEQAGTAAQTADEWQGICKHALRLGEQSLAKDDFPHAQRFFALAQNIARRDNRREDLIRCSRKLEELEQARTAQRRISKHAYALVQSPDDPAANAAVGRYLCLVKGDWERGLARLSRGDDVHLRQLAHRERRPPATTDQQVDVADGWWDWAETATLRLERAHARQRAAHWYREALPGLSASLAKSRAEKRIAEAEDANPPAKAQPVANLRPTAG